ncbi:YihY/virulence factor BrkB family protein [Pontibacter sp. MBLB2868]|uniref:YihY/virulence factor BrkB family protein n=1 Tax=Pontibacter sp. MBLB2868 TaxID=3451555 RepID=UPI003F752314
MINIKSFASNAWDILKETKENFQQGEPIVFSAAIAFFTIFSLPAISIVVTLIASLFFSEAAVRAKLVGNVAGMISAKAGQQVNTVLENVVNMPTDFWSMLLGIVVVVQSASIMFFIIQKALNSVWHVRVKKGVSIRKLAKHRLGAIAIVAGLGLLLIISLMLDFIIAFFKEELVNLMEDYFTPAVRVVNTLFYLSVVFLFFTTIHKILPDVKVTWKDALAGGGITSILFLIGKQVINFALTSVKLIGIYAAAGSLVVVLLWVFYSSIIFMLGAEVTKAYANKHGRQGEPSSIAVKYNNIIDDKV